MSDLQNPASPTAEPAAPTSGSLPRAYAGGLPAVDRLNRVVAGAVGLAILIVYTITLSPDVSFWDAGEFIATAHSLGIPHPPGTPLYVLMGRVFSILGSGFLGVVSPAQAVNLMSAIPSAIAALFLYLCVVRVGKKIWNGGDQGTWCTPAVVAGITAALFAAFANTLWINSIEAEVYAVSGMWAIFTTWLILVWADSEPKDERLLVVIAYLLSLNIGVHLATYLAALAILPFAFLYERRLAMIVSFVVVFTMAKDLQFFLIIVGLLVLPTLQHGLLPTEYYRRFRGTLLTAHGVAILLVLVAINWDPSPIRTGLIFGGPVLAFLAPWIFLRPPRRYENPFTDLGFLLTLVTVLGFSCHLFLPIRSALNPAINEAQPDTWDAFWQVILRSQYRPVSVFERQATWSFQFDHMFWRYFREQWSPDYLWWLLGVPGVIIHARRNPRTFVLFGFLFLWTSAVLVLKMNFTDHEVRERDYFFAPGFFYFAAWMGLGLGWLTHLAVSGVRGALARPVALAAALASIVIAAIPARSGWETHDRRGNWVAHDYAYNMLAGLEPDAVVFTNGDNDTFPLWYMQEVNDFRKDVRVVNLSLLNTPWYAEQLKDETPRVPMSLTTEQIYAVRPYRDPETRRVVYVKDILARDIVNQVVKEGSARPVYFAVTVDDLMSLEPYLKLEGLVFRFDWELPAKTGTDSLLTAPNPEIYYDSMILDNVDLATTRHNLEDVYQYRGLLKEDGTLDDEVYRNSNEGRLTTNYAAAWARMALTYARTGDPEKGIDCMYRALDISPGFDPVVSGLGDMLIQAGRLEEAKELYSGRLESNPSDVRAYERLGRIAGMSDDWGEAIQRYHDALRLDPGHPEVLSGLYQAYEKLGRPQEAANVVEQWLKFNPEDLGARNLLNDLRVGQPGPQPPTPSADAQ